MNIIFGTRVKLGGFYDGLVGTVVGRKVVPKRQAYGSIYNYVDENVYVVKVIAMGQEFQVPFDESDIVAWNTRFELNCHRTHWFGHGPGCYRRIDEWPPQEVAS